MRINEDLLKSVFFIGFKDHVKQDLTPVGSAVYLCNNEATQGYAVTAAHVINELKNRGVTEIYIFINSHKNKIPLNDGKEGRNFAPPKLAYETNVNDWKMDKNDQTLDISYYPINFSGEVIDSIAIKFDACMDNEIFTKQEIGLGEEVVITGLFHQHFGNQKNIPIVRVGNLAALNEEKVKTKLGLMDAYLIEARSIGGISGAPVYFNLGHSRFMDGTVKHITHAEGNGTILMGIIHGHYDENISDVNDQNLYEKINMGIAIVTPIQKAIALIHEYEKK